MYFCKNVSSIEMDDGKNTFLSLLKQKDNNILRDTLMLVNADQTDSGKIDVGISVIYPKCSTTGHSHKDKEEVYYIISGSGDMIIGEDTFPIKSGDAIYIPYGGLFHKTVNTDNTPMKYVWITNKR